MDTGKITSFLAAEPRHFRGSFKKGYHAQAVVDEGALVAKKVPCGTAERPATPEIGPSTVCELVLKNPDTVSL
jgi:hypothetical protein